MLSLVSVILFRGRVHPVQVLSGVLSSGGEEIGYILSRSCLDRSYPGPVWGGDGYPNQVTLPPPARYGLREG